MKQQLLKVNNLIYQGAYDYKDLNLNEIIPGSQHYPHWDSGLNYCVLATTQDEFTIRHDDIDFLLPDEYEKYVGILEATREGAYDMNNESQELPTDDSLQDNRAILVAMAELAEKQEVDHMTVLLAMADLVETKRGVK